MIRLPLRLCFYPFTPKHLYPFHHRKSKIRSPRRGKRVQVRLIFEFRTPKGYRLCTEGARGNLICDFLSPLVVHLRCKDSEAKKGWSYLRFPYPEGVKAKGVRASTLPLCTCTPVTPINQRYTGGSSMAKGTAGEKVILSSISCHRNKFGGASPLPLRLRKSKIRRTYPVPLARTPSEVQVHRGKGVRVRTPFAIGNRS